MMVRAEVGRRRKERCQKRREEIHPEGVESRENIVHKRRKVNQAGEYKKVLAMHKPSRDLEMDRGTEQEECKNEVGRSARKEDPRPSDAWLCAGRPDRLGRGEEEEEGSLGQGGTGEIGQGQEG